MNRRVYLEVFLMLLLPFVISNNALAVTIDLFSLMNHNATLYTNSSVPSLYTNADVVYLGDNGATYQEYTSYPAVEQFSLPVAPAPGGSFDVSITWWGTEFSNNNFTINSSGPFVLDVTGSSNSSTRTKKYTGLNSELISTGLNTLTFNLDKSGSNYEDMVINEFTLEYTGVGNGLPSTVPEPSTIVLLGGGILGLGWYGRKRKKA